MPSPHSDNRFMLESLISKKYMTDLSLRVTHHGGLRSVSPFIGQRQQKSIRARQLAERQDVQIAHNMQFTDFNQAWDR